MRAYRKRTIASLLIHEIFFRNGDLHQINQVLSKIVFSVLVICFLIGVILTGSGGFLLITEKNFITGRKLLIGGIIIIIFSFLCSFLYVKLISIEIL